MSYFIKFFSYSRRKKGTTTIRRPKVISRYICVICHYSNFYGFFFFFFSCCDAIEFKKVADKARLLLKVIDNPYSLVFIFSKKCSTSFLWWWIKKGVENLSIIYNNFHFFPLFYRMKHAFPLPQTTRTFLYSLACLQMIIITMWGT